GDDRSDRASERLYHLRHVEARRHASEAPRRLPYSRPRLAAPGRARGWPARDLRLVRRARGGRERDGERGAGLTATSQRAPGSAGSTSSDKPSTRSTRTRVPSAIGPADVACHSSPCKI